MNDRAPVLQCRDLSRTVRVNGEAKTIVRDFSATFESGQTYSILGPSGAGKSSVLRLLNRLDEPTGGEVLLHGRRHTDYTPCELRRKIGYLFPAPYLFDGSVCDNLRLADAGLTDAEIARLSEHTGISRFINTEDISGLSTGEKQRVSLARLLAMKPDVVLLDEPTAALDPTSTATIERLIRMIANDDGLAVVMVSHDPEQVVRIGGHASLMVQGRIIETGPAEQVVRDPHTDEGRRYRDRELQ